MAAKDAVRNSDDYAADNTGRNVRDQGDATLTPLDQSPAEADVKITQAIRRAIAVDKALSMNARNVKIITIARVMTLRGPVESATEKAAIAQAAESVSGVSGVDNQMEVKP
jgi:osmotically-inducible protein OsmY